MSLNLMTSACGNCETQAMQPLQGIKLSYYTQGRPSLRFGQPWATSILAFQATRAKRFWTWSLREESRVRRHSRRGLQPRFLSLVSHLQRSRLGGGGVFTQGVALG